MNGFKKILPAFYLKRCNETDSEKDGKRNGEDGPIKVRIGEDNEETEERNDQESAEDQLVDTLRDLA